MIWLGIVLLLTAGALATVGAVTVLRPQRDGAPEAGAERAITGLGVLATAIASAAVGATVLAAGGTGAEQLGVFAGAAVTVALPLLAVGYVHRARGLPPTRRDLG